MCGQQRLGVRKLGDGETVLCAKNIPSSGNRRNVNNSLDAKAGDDDLSARDSQRNQSKWHTGKAGYGEPCQDIGPNLGSFRQVCLDAGCKPPANMQGPQLRQLHLHLRSIPALGASLPKLPGGPN